MADEVWVALDLATTTGWAVCQGARPTTILSGSESYKARRFEGGGMRFLHFRRWLDDLLGRTGRVDWLVFEEVRGHKGTDAAHIYGGLLAVLTAWCEERGIPYMGVPVQTIKKHATGSGNANKDKIKAAMIKKGHTAIVDDNEADALSLMYWMIDNATARPASVRSAPDRQPRGRVPLVDL